MQIHQIIERSRANGPGIRFTMWVQGCSRLCYNCTNPETHDPRCGYKLSVDAIFSMIIKNLGSIEGVSISGGEPLDQSKEIFLLIKKIKKETDLSVIIWTGYELEEIKKAKLFEKLSNNTDLLITGPYIDALHKPEGLRGSSNQDYLFFTKKYSIKDLDKVPLAEIHFRDGQIQITGINTEEIKGWFK